VITFLKSIGIGLLVIIVMVGPWSILASLNLHTTPSLPWSAPVMAVYLWSAWRYAGGIGPPRSTREFRRALLRARALTLREWRSCLLTGVLAIAALWSLYGVVSIYIPAHIQRTTTTALPIQSMVAAVLMSALVAAVSEEAGCRGYMQVPLEKRFGPAVAIASSAIVFTAIHLGHGASVLQLLPFYAAAGVVYGLLAYAAGSILPALVLHFIGDLILFSLRSFHIVLWKTQKPSSWQNTYATLGVASAVVFMVGSVLAFRRLLRQRGGVFSRTQTQRNCLD